MRVSIIILELLIIKRAPLLRLDETSRATECLVVRQRFTYQTKISGLGTRTIYTHNC